MRFEITRRPHPNVARYHGMDYALAKDFADKVHKELGDFIKAIVLFGSAARQERSPVGEHDTDVLMVVNDLTIVASQEVIAAYRVIVDKTASSVSKRLHISTMRLTQLWDHCRNGDPLLVNILREGLPLYDSGFIEPMQVLLSQGRIRPTKEAVWAYYAKSPLTLENSGRHVLAATVDLYWAAVDAAHAALMHVGEMPGIPEHLPDAIEQRLVKHDLAPKSAPKIMAFFYALQKDITKRERQNVSGEEYDRWKRDAEAFVKMMRNVIEQK